MFLVFKELKEKKNKAFFPLVFLLVTRKKIFKGKKKQNGNLFLVFREFKKKKKREKAFVPLVFLVTRKKNLKKKNTKGKKHIRPCGFPFG